MLKPIRGLRALLSTLLLAILASLSSMPSACAAPADNSAEARVTAMYTTWDDYYFYAAFLVHDLNVAGTNKTPTSQPQQDDDIEVFFETDNAKASVRTPQTYQMAVSAAGGSYFSVGDGHKIPVAKEIFTYKYAATVDGNLNDASNSDTGYTIELAIPWQEMGQAGPPKDGTTWGFNVISRDRGSVNIPATRFYSLSPNVQSAADVQDPSKWSQIVFDSSGAAGTVESVTKVISPSVTTHYPLINGRVASGEWPPNSSLAFGTTPVTAAAPTTEEEPNNTTSALTTLPNAPITLKPVPPPDKPVQTANAPDVIVLPHGGTIKIVPGGIKNSPEANAPVPRPVQAPDTGQPQNLNPLTPKYKNGYIPPATSPVSLTGTLTLGPDTLPRLVMAIYRPDYNADARKGPAQNVWDAQGMSLLADQPINGVGPWFSGLRPLWHRQQLTDLNRDGIDVALIRVRADDPLLSREIDALVEALQEMKAQGIGYPLIGVDLTGDNPPDPYTILRRIPTEFQATLGDKGDVVYLGNSSYTIHPQQDLGLAVLGPDANVAVISPGKITASEVVDRKGGQTYTAAWTKAADAKPDFVVIDSWNDFTNGTEICASRQYGEQVADDTRLKVIAFNGTKQWHAKYLSVQVPAIVRPKALYQIPIRVENAGTLPWRAGEDYSLAVRWYKDGRLYDDSAPHVPVGVDVLPGQSASLGIGLVARNGYGDDIEPGEYTLVVDMVQGDDRWFSYAGDSPLQIPIVVAAAGDTIGSAATFLGAECPVSMQSGLTYPVTVHVRNDTAASWTSADTRLVYKIQQVNADTGTITLAAQSAGQPLSANPVPFGEAATVQGTIALVDAQGQPLPPGQYRLHWYVEGVKDSTPLPGSFDTPLEIVASDPGASFTVSKILRTMQAGKTTTADLTVQNLGGTTWHKSDTHLGYHWYYLDGVEQRWDGSELTALPQDLPPGASFGPITAKVRVPDQPGRYALVWDVRLANGTWASTTEASKGTDLLQTFITVIGKGPVTTVDLSKAATVNGLSDGSTTNSGSFDGNGSALPIEMVPPDGTAEVEGNPLQLSPLGPPYYPSGFYSSQAPATHAIPFLYPAAQENASNVVACTGQTIALPGGSYKTIHLLMAATGGSSVEATFAGKSVTVADWGSVPTDGLPAFHSPYRFSKDGAVPTPCYLGDYAINLNGDVHLDSLTLPNAPAIKILAISLEK